MTMATSRLAFVELGRVLKMVLLRARLDPAWMSSAYRCFAH